MSAFLVIALYGFSWVMQYFQHNELIPYALTPITLPWFRYFLLYCGLIFLFLILFHRNYKKKQLWFLFFVWLIMFAGVGILGFTFGLQAVMLLIMSAYAEEFLKIGTTENLVSKTEFYSSRVLFFSVLVALGFSIVENLFYVGQQVFGGASAGIVSLVFGRGFFSSLVHIIATGVIALVLYKLYQRTVLQQLSAFQKVVRVMIGMLIGVALHIGYNIAVEYSQVWVYAIVVIGGYFLLSYVLFLSDELYKGE
ncbi:MAG: PrsW family intramembrane metalloprotease [Candidatus Peribacteria bacterium]|jgi:RsiW-degrading membrane proteinase PrsW (M82 family)|nr:PrsW family intramembrane metalloprotease [Candidatus Peribacteria bacterium]